MCLNTVNLQVMERSLSLLGKQRQITTSVPRDLLPEDESIFQRQMQDFTSPILVDLVQLRIH